MFPFVLKVKSNAAIAFNYADKGKNEDPIKKPRSNIDKEEREKDLSTTEEFDEDDISWLPHSSDEYEEKNLNYSDINSIPIYAPLKDVTISDFFRSGEGSFNNSYSKLGASLNISSATAATAAMVDSGGGVQRLRPTLSTISSQSSNIEKHVNK